MTERPKIGVGVIGLGVMGRTHIGGDSAAAGAGLPCGLVAVGDPDPARLSGRVEAKGNMAAVSGDGDRVFDPSRVRGYTGAAELLADPGVHLVSICTYTDTHADLAIAALKAGKHVLVEKPVAVRAADVRRVAEAARGAKTLC